MLKAVGDYDGAVASYDACIRAAPDSGETYWSLANLKTYRFDDATVAEMEKRVADAGRQPQSEVNFLFALGKAYEDRGDFERAWEFYRRGNEKQRAEVTYDPVQTEVMNDRLIERLHGGVPRSPVRGAGDPDPSPIFILGLPRSGSTLLEQILASHSAGRGHERAALHRPPRDLAEPQPRRRHQLPGGDAGARAREPRGARRANTSRSRACTAGRGAPRFIDKMPNNFPNVGFIALILPNAKIIDARRHPLDACLSCYRQLFAKGQNFTYDLTEIGEYYLQYQRMMDHWAARAAGPRADRAVRGGRRRTSSRRCGACSSSAACPGRTPACASTRASGRCARRQPEQVRQPIYDRSVGHWQHYERHLGELIDVIAPIRDRYRRYEPAPDAPRARPRGRESRRAARSRR